MNPQEFVKKRGSTRSRKKRAKKKGGVLVIRFPTPRFGSRYPPWERVRNPIAKKRTERRKKRKFPPHWGWANKPQKKKKS